ncbi:DUF2274 domain-containing protein [Novosphingobium sp. SG720]|uniref:DUF2274 domain-containing protein n=1 Tax=Novosphingobium sp. SG720 TaxID=2586998 RepID=UPI001447326D|nr:DUF2274 domain-containing protein [Novosphingobium sp. SG720]NKJ44834.1 hypothetical protein [Novosphingobium sp. SG720]
MADLKLPRLPDRTPVKLTISVTPDLHLALVDYATIYQQAYGDEQAIADLVPHMIAAFLASDRSFAKARDGLERRK